MEAKTKQKIRATIVICMGRRLEKYYLLCNTAFLSLFTIKLVQYNIYDNIHSKLEQKKPAKYIVNFRYISEVSDIYYTKKYTLSWNKKSRQNIS